MANPKRKKFSESLKKISKVKFGNENLLSADLAGRVGTLGDRTKITIRLDSRVIDAAKKLDEELGGVGYQKIINDRLLASFGLQQESNYVEQTRETMEKLLDEKMEKIREVEKMLEKRIERLEKKQA